MSKNIIDTNLHEHFSFKIDNGQQPLRIDKFLMSRIENATRNKIQNAINCPIVNFPCKTRTAPAHITKSPES